MTCGPRNTFIGISQEFRYGTGPSLISVALSIENFEPGEGEGLLKELGYAHIPMARYWRTADRSTQGTTYLIGPSFYPPEEFEWRLQGLTDLQFHALQAMAELQQTTKQRIRLLDNRYALVENLPRTRAKIGAEITGPMVFPGRAAYYAQFYIWIMEFSPDLYRNSGQHRLTIKAVEMDKVALTEDI